MKAVQDVDVASPLFVPLIRLPKARAQLHAQEEPIKGIFGGSVPVSTSCSCAVVPLGL